MLLSTDANDNGLKIKRPDRSRHRRLGSLLAFLYRYAHLAFPTAAAVLTLSSTYILFGPQLNRCGDNMYHLMNEYALLHAIQAGASPFGPLGMEFGIPLLRFYQPLFYLYNLAIHLIAGFDLRAVHNVTIIVCFALSPFSYLYFLQKLGLNRWAAAFGSYVSMISIAAFGNSFEAYHQAGIVTQSMGGLFFPWFMGNFIGMFRGENRATGTAVLFAIAFLSHAIMSVFAVFAGALYFAVTSFKVRVIWKRLLAFGILGACLVAFWVLPFIAHTYDMRPVPDSIIRGRGVHWFTSVSKSELAMVLTTGRLLDDPPRKGDARDSNDKLMDRISIIHALKTRPPVVTALTALGALVALFGFRRTSRRFLLAGFLFSLMLFAGPDDFHWLRYLPFMKQIQTFRCTYLIEFFAFGLVGIGAETLLRWLWKYVRGRTPFLRYPFVTAWILVFGTAAFFCGNEIVLLGRRHLVVRNPRSYDAMIDASAELPDRGFPYRVGPVYKGRFKLRQGWFRIHGYHPYCTHWKGVGPSAAYHLCLSLTSGAKNSDLHALAGIRYFSGHTNKIKSAVEAKDGDGDPVFERLPNGVDRRGGANGWHYLLDTGRDHFLRPMVGKLLPVVCSKAQWIWFSKAWIRQYSKWLWEESTPIPMRVDPGELSASDLVNHSSVVAYMNHEKLKDDAPALRQLIAEGGVVISPIPVPGIKTIVIPYGETLWKQLPSTMRRPPKAKMERHHREELDPGFDLASIKQLASPNHDPQIFAFDVDLLKSIVMTLPVEAVPGWKAILDGQPLSTFATGPDMVGVFVPEGAHRLVFHWKMPLWHLITIWISIGAVCAVLGIWMRAAYAAFRKR